MKRFFLAATILISASAYADAEDFSVFLKRYEVFKSERDATTKSAHAARFGGKLTFKECQPLYGSEGNGIRKTLQGGATEESCDCPEGNNYAQCLMSAQATIIADPRDIGGRAYVLAMAGTAVLNQSGRWVQNTQKNTYTTVVSQMPSMVTLNIQIPSEADIARACAKGDTFDLFVGYGAVMPMDVDFASRMKSRSAEFNIPFDEEGFIFSRARINGNKPKKAGQIGSIQCRPASDS